MKAEKEKWFMLNNYFTEKELELINWSLATNKEDFEHEGCLPKHKVMFDRLTELLKKLKKLTEVLEE